MCALDRKHRHFLVNRLAGWVGVFLLTISAGAVEDGIGLRGDYYGNVGLSTLCFSRTDPAIDMDWGLEAPESSMSADRFSVRWTGQIQPRYSETYTFYTGSDDGVRLWVDNRLLIANWTDHSWTTNSATITLTAGSRYDLRMEFYDNVQNARIRLEWSSASQEREVVPQRVLFSTPMPEWDTYSDTWVATDGLGRSLSLSVQAGAPRTNRSVGMFYFLWLNGGAVYDITQILAANPQNPQWGPRWSFHFWGRPLFDYYRSSDRHVIRKHAQMLMDAGVDALFFDVSNAYTYDAARQALCEEFEMMRLAGQSVPKLSFLTHSSASNTVQSIYDTFYGPRAFPNLWYQWKGRPLMLAKPSELSAPLRDFFNLRYSWAWNPGQDKWPWLEYYPQRFGWHESSSVAEEIPVCVAQHPTSNVGRSYHNGAEPPPSGRNPDLGLCFSEQWGRALSVGAEMTFVTGWNEWIAQRFVSGLDGSPNFLGAPTTNGQSYFVDLYNQEFSRDVEPMSGGHGDHYYYQLVDAVRRLKGVREIETVHPHPISLTDGSFEDWSFVTPEFRDHIGDTVRRNHPSFDSAVTLVNRSGRNDIVAAKVSCDPSHLHFYARTRSLLTPPSTNWMLLFIDADANPQTGWLGYDLVVNRTNVSATSTVVERNIGGNYEWGNPLILPMRYAGRELEISVPRTLVSTTVVDFKWADNSVITGQWSDFTLNGDAAPNDRFRYRARIPPSLVIQVIASNRIRLAWPGTAQDYSLQASSDPVSGFSNTGLSVTNEGLDCVSYDVPGSATRFYRLAR